MKTIVTIIFVLSITCTFAQPNEIEADPFDDPISNNQNTDPSYDWSWKAIPMAPPPPPTPVPIDGGLSLLLVAGVSYGIRKLTK